MKTQRKKLIVRNHIIAASCIILCIMTTALFFTYKGEKLLDLAKPQQQVTYYKISELTKEQHTVLPKTIKIYRAQHMVAIIEDQDNHCDCNEENQDIKCNCSEEDVNKYE